MGTTVIVQLIPMHVKFSRVRIVRTVGILRLKFKLFGSFELENI